MNINKWFFATSHRSISELNGTWTFSLTGQFLIFRLSKINANNWILTSGSLPFHEAGKTLDKFFPYSGVDEVDNDINNSKFTKRLYGSLTIQSSLLYYLSNLWSSTFISISFFVEIKKLKGKKKSWTENKKISNFLVSLGSSKSPSR